MTRLREAMVQRGASIDQIAAELRARFKYGIRAAYRHAVGLTLEQVAERYNTATGDADARTTGPRISEWESWPQGGRRPTAFNLITLAHVFGTDPDRLITFDEEALLDERERGVLHELHAARRQQSSPDSGVSGSGLVTPDSSRCCQQIRSEHDSELEAVELARRVAASDLGKETLARLEAAVDDLATAYPVTAPDELLNRVHVHLGYVSRLIDAQAQRRRLLVVGGWLALLAATLHIDLEQRSPARGWLETATSLAEQTGHDEIHAWRYETEAWQVLTDGEYRRAVELSQTAQRIAPRGSSAAIQATAQEGRAWARLGESRDTYDAIDRVHKLAAPLSRPDRPEHHYRYDPTKAVAYTATTLAWVGDTAAESYAREIIARLHRDGDSRRWPRRVTAANIDLALALLTTDHLDEASARTLAAMNSGMLVPSNHWRALEVVHAIETRGLPEGHDLRDAYEQMRAVG